MEKEAALSIVRFKIPTAESAVVEAFLESSKSTCEDGSLVYRPFIVAAYLMGLQYQDYLNDRLDLALIKADGAEWTDPKKILDSAIEWLLRSQIALDGSNPCPYDPQWDPAKVKKEMLSGCDQTDNKQSSGVLGAMLIR